MSYQVLARKWRPHTFEDLVGQQHVIQALVNGLDQDRVHHAFLLTGTRGVGKTTIARILAKCLNCEQGVSSKPCGECASCVDVDEGRFVDMLEIDAASKTKVDDTRELLETVQYTPTRGRYKVYIIDEVHMLSKHSFNALLKTLEEPPPHVKFILATTDPQNMPVTILSRCLRFSLSRLLPDQISEHLARIVEEESVPAEASALMRIARGADGSMRDGLSLLDQAIAFGGGSLKDDDVANMLGSIDHLHVSAIIDALVNDDAAALMGVVEDLVSHSRNLENTLDELAEAMHRIALIQAAPGFRDPDRTDWESLEEHAGKISPEDAQLYYQIAITGRRDLGLAPDPRTGLEMTLLRMLAFKPAESGSTPEPRRKAQSSSPGVTGGGAQSRAAGSDRLASGGAVMSPAAAARAAFEAMSNKPAAPVMPVAHPPHAENMPANIEQEPMASEPEFDFGAASESEMSAAGPAHQVAEPPVQRSEPAPNTVETSEPSLPDWTSLQEKLELSAAAREFARNLQLESANDGHWRFLVPDSLAQLGTDAVVQGLRTALANQLASPVVLELHTANGPVQSVAAAAEQAKADKMSEAERAIEEDPTVQDLKNKFAAKIVPDSIQPLQ